MEVGERLAARGSDYPVGHLAGGSWLALVWRHCLRAASDSIMAAERCRRDLMVEPAARPGVPSLLISSPAFLVAEFRWQWYPLASVPTALAASLGTFICRWLGPANSLVIGTLVLAVLCGLLHLVPLQATPGMTGRERFRRALGVPLVFCILIGTVNVACNAVGNIEFIRAFFLSGFLFGNVVNVCLVLASWRLLPVHVVAKQISAILRSAAGQG